MLPAAAFAAHPLITEDTGTQGDGGWQLEITGERGNDRAQDEQTHTHAYKAVLSWGLADTADVILSVPWQRQTVETPGVTKTHRGNADVGLDLKWRFHEHGAISFALKPGMTCPGGNDDIGIGTGRKTYSLYFVSSVARDPLAFHLHLGYIRNNNTRGERENIGHVSFAATYQFSDRLRLVVDLSGETNRDPTSQVEPTSAIAGFIVSLGKNTDIDLGYKKGLSDPETDRTLLAGVTWRF